VLISGAPGVWQVAEAVWATAAVHSTPGGALVMTRTMLLYNSDCPATQVIELRLWAAQDDVAVKVVYSLPCAFHGLSQPTFLRESCEGPLPIRGRRYESRRK